MGKKSRRRGGNTINLSKSGSTATGTPGTSAGNRTNSTSSRPRNFNDDDNGDDLPDMKQYIRSKTRMFRDEGTAETFRKIDEMDKLSLEDQKRVIRTALEEDTCTDVIQNDNDLYGDGDQRPITSVHGRDIARELYAMGGDIYAHFINQGSISSFAMACVTGSVETVYSTLVDGILKSITQPWSQSIKLKKLLETRETSLRLSPLLLIVSAGKNVNHIPIERHLSVARMLLKYGASPNARDVFGKTVCHYGAGAFATTMTLQVVDMCIRASESSHMYGKTVELYGLQSASSMNGTIGIVGGYDEVTNRRLIYIPSQEREVSIKVNNLRLVNQESSQRQNSVVVPLYNVQDRLGSISLHEVILKDNKEVAEFLLQKHHASIHIKDADGITPLQLSTQEGQFAFSVSKMILKVAREEGGTTRKEAKKNITCSSCNKPLNKKQGLECNGCNMAWYCNRTCRSTHWNNGGHNIECSIIAKVSKGIQLDSPASNVMDVNGNDMFYTTMSFQSSQSRRRGSNNLQQPQSASSLYKKPSSVNVNELFVLKVQAGPATTNTSMPLMLYDETRTCQFTISPNQRGYNEVLNEVRKEQAWEGRKTFMKASFNEHGTCTIYPTTAGVKAHYKW